MKISKIYYSTLIGENKMETQLITIPIKTDMDTSQLLDIVLNQIAQTIADEIVSYGNEAEVEEDDITIETLDD
jgi:hypothetical protein